MLLPRQKICRLFYVLLFFVYFFKRVPLGDLGLTMSSDAS